MRRSGVAAAIAAGAAALVAAAEPPVRFADITARAGIRFVHNTGAFGRKWLPETMGAGCLFFDADGDERPDLLLVNGTNWPGRPGRPTFSRLYRNQGDGTFRDVTRASGLAVELYGMGGAAADYDNDGDQDLFVTALGQSRLFRNEGRGLFTDVTRRAGLWGPNEFSSSAAWVDYDRDGDVDLVVGNYVRWTPQTDIFCTLDGRTKSYCTPESYTGEPSRLWRNRGDGTFEDVSARAGIRDPGGKTLGVAVLDYDRDGWPDLLLANDTQPNKLYRNRRDGTFEERGVIAGVAFSEEGVARAGMGVDAADYDRSGYPSVVIANFSNQMLALYHNEGNGLFIDEAPRTALGRDSLLTLGFAAFFFDADLDGWLDIFVANGHIENEIERIQPRVKYAQPAHLFRNLGGRRFEDIARAAGLGTPRVARGAAYADIDDDGDLDLAITTNGGPAVLLRNDGTANQALRVRLVGTKSNRDGIGAVVHIAAGRDRQWQMVRTGSSYLSQSELTLTFGLGAARRVDSLEVRWPSGAVERLGPVGAGMTITVQEGRGIVARRPIRPRTAVAETP
jgi:hypothetical protein